MDAGQMTCRYQMKDGEVINQLFPMGVDGWNVPPGWYHHPKDAKAAGSEDPIDLATSESLTEEIKDMDAAIVDVIQEGSLETANDDSPGPD